MKYKSTRGKVVNASFEDALFSGYAPDGGLYVPETLPTIPESLLFSWKQAPPTYPDVVKEIVSCFVSEDELPREILQQCIGVAYAGFDTENVIELRKCKSVATEGCEFTVVEMYHGKTKSFKDYALSLVGKLMEYYVQKKNNNVTVLVGTSGDTGSAAIEAVRGLKGIDIIVLYPQGKVSEVQQLQMTTILEDNVHVFEVEGTSDDLDEPIKQSFPEPGLLSINSVNWARIMIQIAHYVYLCTLERLVEPVDIYVPTGGAGNLAAGLIATLLGFPLNLYSAQNENGNVETLINKGRFVMGGQVIETFSNAMDIRSSYNMERLLYFLSDSSTVADIMDKNSLLNEEAVMIPEALHERMMMMIKGAMKVDTPTTLEVMRDCWNSNSYLICPHTATAVALLFATSKKRLSKNKAFVISTASPEKFPDAVKAAQLSRVESPDDSSLLHELKSRQRKEPKLMRKGENWFHILQAEIKQVRARAAVEK